MQVTSFGCSFIYGTDLQDCIHPDSPPSCLTWPALIAKRLNLGYQCWAKGGSGNLCIADRVLQRLHDFPNDLFVINWTFIDRFDYSDPSGSHFNNQRLKDYKTLTPGNCDLVTDFYYKNLHSDFRDKLSNLLYVHSVVTQLRKKNAKFVMTGTDDIMFCKKWHAPLVIDRLQDEIRPFFSYFNDMNFMAWIQNEGFAVTQSGHPKEEAHLQAADLMQPIIDAILHRA